VNEGGRPVIAQAMRPTETIPTLIDRRVSMSFTQMMTVRATDAERLQDLMDGWHREQHGVAPGYERARLLADRARPDHWVIEVDFRSEEEARRNDDRPETRAWADRLRELADGEPEYRDFELTYTTT
jgi:quinol monooxygenase YgiN